MAPSLAEPLTLLGRVIDWFIPPQIAADRDMRQQARMFLMSHLFGPFIGNTVPLALYVVDPSPGYPIAVLAASITGFWIFPFVLKAGGRYQTLALLSIQNLMFCILWSCFFYGGVTSPTLPWVLTIPLLSFFYLSAAPSLRLTVLVMFGVNCLAFASAYRLGLSPERHDLPFAALQGLGLVSTVAASLYVAMMAIYYGKAQASQGEIETEMKQHMATAAELRRATEEAERAGVAKAEFLAKMSHELRTPLNAVIGYSQMLLEDAADEGDAEMAADLDKIHVAGQHLLKLVNEVLDLSKIEAGKMELFNQPTDVVGLVENVVAGFRKAADAAGDKLVVDVEGPVGTALCDEAKVRQALSQLVDNAIKFTSNGEVRVAVRKQDGRVFFDVRDTGIGIEEHVLPALFEHFTVGDDSSASKYGGTGLGLALARKLSRLMGGDVTVTSRVGVGSIFTMSIPHSLVEEEAVPGSAAAPAAGDCLDARIEALQELVAANAPAAAPVRRAVGS
ncbi:MAG: HAMP domain-containing histidine kinase [Methylobacteriaceae bacterium]|nr:HAMP domain-containing histidine kinase [Methylobacteriaceae bacterium]